MGVVAYMVYAGNNKMYTNVFNLLDTDISKRKLVGTYSNEPELVDIHRLSSITKKIKFIDKVVVLNPTLPLGTDTVETFCDKLIEYNIDIDKIVVRISIHGAIHPFDEDTINAIYSKAKQEANRFSEYDSLEFFNLENELSSVMEIMKYAIFGYYKSRSIQYREHFVKEACNDTEEKYIEKLERIYNDIIENINKAKIGQTNIDCALEELKTNIEEQYTKAVLNRTSVDILNAISKFKRNKTIYMNERIDKLTNFLRIASHSLRRLEKSRKFGGTIYHSLSTMRNEENTEQKRYVINILEDIDCNSKVNELSENERYSAYLRLPYIIAMGNIKDLVNSLKLHGIDRLYYDDSLSSEDMMKLRKGFVAALHYRYKDYVMQDTTTTLYKSLYNIIKELFDMNIYIRELSIGSGMLISVPNKVKFNELCEKIDLMLKVEGMHEYLYEIVKLGANEQYMSMKIHANNEKFIPSNNNFWRKQFAKS